MVSRSQGPLDIVAIASAVSALSQLISGRPDILEIDVNPFIAYPDGAMAVDALVRLDAAIPGLPKNVLTLRQWRLFSIRHPWLLSAPHEVRAKEAISFCAIC